MTGAPVPRAARNLDAVRRRTEGFSIVEVLVALAIVAGLVLTLQVTLSDMARAWHRHRAQATASDVLAPVEAIIRQAVREADRVDGSRGRIALVGALPAALAEPGLGVLEFGRTGAGLMLTWSPANASQLQSLRRTALVSPDVTGFDPLFLSAEDSPAGPPAWTDTPRPGSQIRAVKVRLRICSVGKTTAHEFILSVGVDAPVSDAGLLTPPGAPAMRRDAQNLPVSRVERLRAFLAYPGRLFDRGSSPRPLPRRCTLVERVGDQPGLRRSGTAPSVRWAT